MTAGVRIVIVSCVYLTVASWATKIPRHWTHEALHRCRVSSKEYGNHHSGNMGFDEQGQCAGMKVPKLERTKYRSVSCMLLLVMMCCILQVYSSVRHEYMFLKHSDDDTDDGHCHPCITSIRNSMEHQLCEHKDTIRIQERHELERSHSNTDGHSQYGRQIKRTVEKYFDSLSGEIERVLSSLFQIQPQYLSVPELVAQPFTTSLTTYLGRVQMEGQVPVEEEMCHEIRRLQSFSGTTVQASPIRLAQSGFYATGREDEARCYSCRKSHTSWQIMDKPDVLHRVISPECPHLNRNEPRNEDSIGSTIYGILGEYSGSNNVTTTDTLPPTTTEIGAAAATEAAPAVSASSLDMNSAVHPLYKNIQSRLDSFRDWDTSHTQDPHVLATAGFFYAGYSDCVRCFYCGVGLKTWEEGDDPWVEHVRWRSSCSYIRRLKGDNFVIQALTNEASPKLTVTDNTAVVARAVEMGYAQQMVERAMTEMSQSYNSPRAAGVTGETPGA
ncbi:death-associated inhibitor of apoptosis 1-like isoform X2 [Haliotis cracherodii]|uniref:death-associated inhibitor of apoptosis 1-like isoform X2 n=1 Tax=Haliotis cracherodii TaxID=6455 RepID=UPI0039E8C4AD